MKSQKDFEKDIERGITPTLDPIIYPIFNTYKMDSIISKNTTKLNNMTREEIYKIIDAERNYQDTKWGLQHDANHEVESYILYMEDYLNEARHLLSHANGVEGGLDVLRKVVALGIACFESHGVPERK